MGKSVVEGPHDSTIDELHHVEGGIVHLDVGTHADDTGNRYAAVGQGADDPVLPGHVVCGRKNVA